MTKQEERLRSKANICFGLTAIILVATIVFLAIPKFNELKTKKDELSQVQNQIASAETDLEIERQEYRKLKEAYSERAVKTEETISTVLPSSPEETDLVREIETYTNKLRSGGNLFEMDSISMGKTKENKDEDYLTIPFQLNFETNYETFMSFLTHMEDTGDTKADIAEANRLMDIQDLTYNINKDKDSGEETINASVSINTYSLPYSLEDESETQK